MNGEIFLDPLGISFFVIIPLAIISRAAYLRERVYREEPARNTFGIFCAFAAGWVYLNIIGGMLAMACGDAVNRHRILYYLCVFAAAFIPAGIYLVLCRVLHGMRGVISG